MALTDGQPNLWLGLAFSFQNVLPKNHFVPKPKPVRCQQLQRCTGNQFCLVEASPAPPRAMQRHRDNQLRGRRGAGPIAEPACRVDKFSQAALRTAVGHSLRKLRLDELANPTKRLPG
jgi:hypothetical protein